jgi:hypothetical protein
MTRYIRLTNIIINTSKIITVDISPTKYRIHFDNKKIDGWMLFSSGTVESIDNKIEICKNLHPKDFKIMERWINKTARLEEIE